MKQKNLGFTLIEMMIAIVMLVIVMTVAIPSMQSTIQNNRISGLTNELSSSLNLARSEAIKRGVSVSICAANASFNGCSNNWGTGWLIFVNPDENATFANNASEVLLRVHQVTGQGVTITTTPNVQVATYNSAGFAAVGSNVNFRIRASGCTGNNARNIAISLTGRLSTTQVACP
ncbi:MAG TPA: GspH/FimT family pseudopilin [Gammaproteobacteria bacterium]|nr:GspH/FimT family pseudopilin [Gammaproteobacteria bacterium]